MVAVKLSGSNFLNFPSIPDLKLNFPSPYRRVVPKNSVHCTLQNNITKIHKIHKTATLRLFFEIKISSKIKK